MSYLNQGLPRPVANELDAPYWAGLAENKLLIQRCLSCRQWQWGPEWICHHCLTFDLAYEEIEAVGTLYSHERVWHPVHPALREQGPYIVVLIELEGTNGTRIIGNLLGDPEQNLVIGQRVNGVFEHHHEEDPAYSLLQWQISKR